LVFNEQVNGNKLSVDLDIEQEETIKDSAHYTATDDLGTLAEINFCMRVDYNYKSFDGDCGHYQCRFDS